MNLRFDRKGTIGQILTSFPSLIFVFVIMLIFVIVSGFISKQHSEKYSLLEDFLDDYVNLKGKAVKVEDAIEKMCVDKSLESVLRIALRDEFVRKHGGNSFVLVGRLTARQMIPQGDNKDYYLYSSYGFDDKIDQTKSIDYNSIGNYFEGVYPQQKSLCVGSKDLKLYVKSNDVEGVL